MEYSSVVATIMAGHNSSQTFLDPLQNLFNFFPQNTKNSKPICFPLGLEYVDFCEPYQFFYTKEFIDPFLCFVLTLWEIRNLSVKYVMIL